MTRTSAEKRLHAIVYLSQLPNPIQDVDQEVIHNFRVHPLNGEQNLSYLGAKQRLEHFLQRLQRETAEEIVYDLYRSYNPSPDRVM